MSHQLRRNGGDGVPAWVFRSCAQWIRQPTTQRQRYDFFC
jgi:hypothetical protein